MFRPAGWNPVAIIAACVLAGGALVAFPAEPPRPAVSQVPVKFVAAHVADMRVPPDFLWAELKRMYVLGHKFRDQGFTVAQIEDEPAAWLGGTIVSKVDQGRVDRRVARFTVIDDVRRLLTLDADYLEGLSLSVSYEVTPTAEGCALHLIAHVRSTERIEHAGELRQGDVQRHVQRLVSANEEALRSAWQAEKQRIEALHRAAAPDATGGT